MVAKLNSIQDLATQVAKKAGVEVSTAEKILRALNVESHIDEVAKLNNGKIDAERVKLAYRISSGGIIA